MIVHPCNRRAAVARMDPEAPETIASRAAGLKIISGKFAGIRAAVGVILINATCHHLNSMSFLACANRLLTGEYDLQIDRSGLPTMSHASEINPGAPAEAKRDLVDERQHQNRTKVFTRYLLARHSCSRFVHAPARPTLEVLFSTQAAAAPSRSRGARRNRS